MAAVRKPDYLHLLNGTFQPCRHGDPEKKPQPVAPLGDPPAHFSPEVADAWAYIVEITPPGVLTISDRIIVEMLAELFAEFREDPQIFLSAKLIRIQQLLGLCGLSPADRSKINLAGRQAKPGAFDDL